VSASNSGEGRSRRAGKAMGIARYRAPRYDKKRKKWRAKYVDLDGTTRECGQFKLKGDAVTASQNKVAELNRSAGRGSQGSLTARDWFDGDWRLLYPREERTLATYDERVGSYIWPHLPSEGYIAFGDLRRPLLRQVQRKLLKLGYAKTTIDGAFSCLSGFLRDAVDFELLEVNPAQRMSVKANDPDLKPKRRRKERRSVPPDEVRLFMSHVDKRYLACCWAPVLTGCRPDELFAMHGAEIDREREMIYLHERVDRNGHLKPGIKGRHFIGAKEERGRWTLFPAVLIGLVDARPRDVSGYLWRAPRGGFWCRRPFYRNVWNKAREASGTDFDLYDLRHTFASRLEAAGVPEADIGSWMGHSRRGRDRPTTTRRVYIHPTFESKHIALQVLTELVHPPQDESVKADE
jgi:integrase